MMKFNHIHDGNKKNNREILKKSLEWGTIGMPNKHYVPLVVFVSQEKKRGL